MLPSRIPITPPRELVTAASITNCCIMTLRFAPSALRMPISLVRSVTDTSMMFITPTPATSREIPAMPPRPADTMAIMLFKESSISLIAVTVYKSSFLNFSYRKFSIRFLPSVAADRSRIVKV